MNERGIRLSALDREISAGCSWHREVVSMMTVDDKFDTELFSDFSAKTLEGSFSAVSMSIFASKYSLYSVF